MLRYWRSFWNARKFVKVGKKFRFNGRYLHVDGHVELGDYCRFRDQVVLRTHGDGKIIFHDRSGASFFTVLDANTLIEIGTGTAIAEHTVIRDSLHVVWGTEVHWRLTPLRSAPIIIKPHVLIGSHCYIGPGVTIGEGAVIGQCSVILKDVGPYEVWQGNPARKLGHRTEGTSSKLLKRDQDMVDSMGLKDDRYGYDGSAAPSESAMQKMLADRKRGEDAAVKDAPDEQAQG